MYQAIGLPASLHNESNVSYTLEIYSQRIIKLTKQTLRLPYNTVNKTSGKTFTNYKFKERSFNKLMAKCHEQINNSVKNQRVIIK